MDNQNTVNVETQDNNPEHTQDMDNIVNHTAGSLMKDNYLNYSMAVITSRALPDVRDGLKPVQRRILHTMHELKLAPSSQFKKSARVVGDVMGKYHPHGDSSIYEAATIMAQHWSKGIVLVDGQGNFGSLDGDPAAAMRYTEMRLSKGGMAFFNDVEKNVVDFQDNYDGTESEPTVLPVVYPNLWVNGAEGIAVGMATYIPPHNLNESIDLALALQENPNLSTDDILKIIPAPDFPTGGVVHSLDGYRSAVETGRGTVKVRSRWHEEQTKSGSPILIIDDIPFKVNKLELINKIKEKVREKEKGFEEIVEILDESDKKNSVRIAITLKRGAIPAVVFNYLVKGTDIEYTYNYNVMALENKVPKQLSLKEIMFNFLAFRTNVIERRARFDLNKMTDRLHILNGMKVVLENIREALDIVLNNKETKVAKEMLMERFSVDDAQARAVLDLKIQRLTGMEMRGIMTELRQLSIAYGNLDEFLANPARIQFTVKQELKATREKFGQDRETEISYENNEISMIDLIKKEDCLIHITHGGYMKRMPLNSVETQARSGKGKGGMKTGDNDYVTAIHSGSTHDMFMVFTESGKTYTSHVWNLPDGNSGNKGRHVRNIFENLKENISNVLIIPEMNKDLSIITVTTNGKVKRSLLSNYIGSFRKNGLQGVNIEDGDKLLDVMLAKTHDQVIVVSSQGRAVRFEIEDSELQSRGRKTVGVKAIDLSDGSKAVSAMIVSGNGKRLNKKMVEKERILADKTIEKFMREVDDTSEMDNGVFLLCVGQNGIGKRTAISEFTPHKRGSKGVNCFNINAKTGPIAKAFLVVEDDNVILTTDKKIVRLAASDIRVTGRNAAGTILMNVDDGKIADAIKVPSYESLEDLEGIEQSIPEDLDNSDTEAQNSAIIEDSQDDD